MKDLKKLALILRAMGITANVLKESVTYNNGDHYEYTYLGRIAERLYHMTHEYSSLEPCVKQKMVDEMQTLATNDFVVLKIKDKHLTRKLTEIFATKEDLVKHLMEQ